jgi:N-acetylneuraminic acid mutarotase
VAAPAPRSTHTAVWTGIEMIIWGGCDNSSCTGGTTRFGDGGRYNPSTDAWRSVSLVDAPDARADHTAVWTGKEGREMIVWGGAGQDGLPRNTGGRYYPEFDAWKPTSTAGAPAPRSDHRAVWTGTEMIIWGRAPQGIKSGGRYDPTTDSWVPTSVNDPRRPRAYHVAVWTGSEMLVWGGGLGGGLSGVGDRYEPATDSWMPMSDAGEPTNREHGLAAVWTGKEMIVWGGQLGTNVFNSGGRYNPATNTWRPTATAGAPLARTDHAMVWTGTRMFVWGGRTLNSVTATGGLYDPASDSWTPTSLAGAPAARRYFPAVWTGSRVIVWGGMDDSVDLDFNSGGVYDPFTDSWTATSTAGAPPPRHFHTALWTGSRLLVWGGTQGTLDDEIYLASGGLYDPATGVWTPTTLANAPSARIWHAGVWTGREMIIWGGCNGPSPCARGQFTGARYDPALDQWIATPLQSAPSARDQHTGIWTGSALIVWGGYADTYSSYTSTGGLYYPPPLKRPSR